MERKILTTTWVILITSGIYQIPFLVVPIAFFVILKKVLFGLYGGVLFFLQRSKTWFTWGWPFVAWGAANVMSYFMHDVSGLEIVYRLIQLLWIYGFVIYFASRQAWIVLEKFPVKYFSFACLLLVAGEWIPEVRDQVLNGFGGNRFGFSIWLSQFVFIVFLVVRRHDENWFFQALAYAAPIILLQVLSGGRAGLLASVLFVIFFGRESKGRNYLFGALYLLVLVVFGTWYGATAGVDSAQSVYRLTPEMSAQVGGEYIFVNSEFLSFLDRFFSYRLSIIFTAFSEFNIWNAFVGKGVGNFHGVMLSESVEVHNIYLRALGELGVVGFAALLSILFFPLTFRDNSTEVRSSKVFIVIFLMIGASHSEILLTGISTCMVFWICYAQVVSNWLATRG